MSVSDHNRHVGTKPHVGCRKAAKQPSAAHDLTEHNELDTWELRRAMENFCFKFDLQDFFFTKEVLQQKERRLFHCFMRHLWADLSRVNKRLQCFVSVSRLPSASRSQRVVCLSVVSEASLKI